ncbi:hypothetical protein [Hallella sp.]|uniref:hypothetical protein n=1 Tax=Hallella sp. TaxID=2980186 RepID=UPI0028485DDB|nr:hypothetical protein [Hallella sp.]MDR3843443.1 hypothetical protein [Hallella sp.]
MKQTKWFFILMAFVLCLGGLTACGSDDDPEEGGDGSGSDVVNTDAARYEITDPNADISFIELTEGGQYFVGGDESDYGAKPMMARRAAQRAAESSDDGLHYGEYTKGANGEYVLNGYGTLTVTKNGEVYEVKIVPEGSTTTKSYNARKVTSTVAASATAKNLCRTWKFQSVAYSFKMGSYTVFDLKANSMREITIQMKAKMKELASKNGEEWTQEDEDEWNEQIEYAYEGQPERLTFTGSGYMYIRFGDNDVEPYMWRMSGNKLQRWNWDEEAWSNDFFLSIDDTALEEGSSETVSEVKGNTLTITQTLRGSEGGVIKYSMTFTK